MSEYVRELARVRNCDVIDDDHGGLGLGAQFEYDDGASVQGLGYRIDYHFIRDFMRVFGVTRLRDVDGKSCWVTHSHTDISLIEPLHKRDKMPSLDVHKWAKEAKTRAEAIKAAGAPL